LSQSLIESGLKAVGTQLVALIAATALGPGGEPVVTAAKADLGLANAIDSIRKGRGAVFEFPAFETGHGYSVKLKIPTFRTGRPLALRSLGVGFD
jgi:hypothetical protein